MKINNWKSSQPMFSNAVIDFVDIDTFNDRVDCLNEKIVQNKNLINQVIEHDIGVSYEVKYKPSYCHGSISARLYTDEYHITINLPSKSYIQGFRMVEFKIVPHKGYKAIILNNYPVHSSCVTETDEKQTKVVYLKLCIDNPVDLQVEFKRIVPLWKQIVNRIIKLIKS